MDHFPPAGDNGHRDERLSTMFGPPSPVFRYRELSAVRVVEERKQVLDRFLVENLSERGKESLGSDIFAEFTQGGPVDLLVGYSKPLSCGEGLDMPDDRFLWSFKGYQQDPYLAAAGGGAGVAPIYLLSAGKRQIREA